MPTTADTHVLLPADSNQALGLARFALDFLRGPPGVRADPDPAVLQRTNLFHTDAVICGISALALNTSAPTILRREALAYPASLDLARATLGDTDIKHPGATVFGCPAPVAVEKAVAANCAAVREWDSNGTNFGYNPALGHLAGEFGHNDFYAVPIAAAQLRGLPGDAAIRGMILLDEIRGRLAEVFSLKTYKIDHVLHGAIASAVTFGAMLDATPDQIESAVGMTVAHFVPFRAIRAGKQLSDSKGASAAISTEAAVLCVKRSLMGFVGPRDIFRNPEAPFCLFQKPSSPDRSPFDLVLARAGADFAVMGMHFKLGLYEHQSAGALQGLIDLLAAHPHLLADPNGGSIASIVVTAYEPAFGIIGDPAKRDPRTRQSADHSMLYLVCSMFRKALALAHDDRAPRDLRRRPLGWKDLMLLPHDFSPAAIADPLTRALMAKMTFQHGGPDYDAKYPDGIPTSIRITDSGAQTFDSGLIMYPAGHARNTTADLADLLTHKFRLLGALASDNPESVLKQLSAVESRSPAEIAGLYNFTILDRGRFE